MADQKPAYFISTSIPYVNAEPHIGHALEYTQTDAYARFHRQQGYDVFFLTGSDENALKNVQAAEAEGISTRELVDKNVEAFLKMAARLQASNDDFIRTSVDQRHFDGAEKLWKAVEFAGDIYSKHYSGLYCVSCETFYSEEELVDGKCPVHKAVEPVHVEEENYFFRLSKYADELHRRISSDELQVVPETRKNEVLRFIEAGLQDISISRSKERAKGWGVPVPDGSGQVMYVWIDALANYITALDYANEGQNYQRYWLGAEHRVHAIGKDILRFHAIYWPGLLLSARVPLPTHIVVHGFLTVNGEKMSKTTGNVVDTVETADEFGTDAVRYYLLREISPHGDGDFSIQRLVERFNADLANDLGNLLNRTVSMINRYRGGVIPESGSLSERDQAFIELVEDASCRSIDLLGRYEPQAALNAIWEIVTGANSFIEQSAPWALSRSEKDGDEQPARQLDSVLFTLAVTIGKIAWLLQPAIPAAAAEISRQLGSAAVDELPVPGQRVTKPSPIFPRIETDLVRSE